MQNTPIFHEESKKSSFGQHLGNTCCLNVAFLLTHFWSFLAIFSELVNKRQHLGNKTGINFFYQGENRRFCCHVLYLPSGEPSKNDIFWEKNDVLSQEPHNTEQHLPPLSPHTSTNPSSGAPVNERPLSNHLCTVVVTFQVR